MHWIVMWHLDDNVQQMSHVPNYQMYESEDQDLFLCQPSPKVKQQKVHVVVIETCCLSWMLWHAIQLFLLVTVVFLTRIHESPYKYVVWIFSNVTRILTVALIYSTKCVNLCNNWKITIFLLCTFHLKICQDILINYIWYPQRVHRNIYHRKHSVSKKKCLILS